MRVMMRGVWTAGVALLALLVLAVAAVSVVLLAPFAVVGSGYLSPPDGQVIDDAATHGVVATPATTFTSECWVSGRLPADLRFGPLDRCGGLLPPDQALATVRAAHLAPTAIVLADAGVRHCTLSGQCSLATISSRVVWIVQTKDAEPIPGVYGITDPACGRSASLVLVDAHTGRIIATVAWGPRFGESCATA